MPVPLISSFLSTTSFKVVNMATGAEVIAGIKVIKNKARFSSTPFRHMKEDGNTIVDGRVILATTIEVDVICPDLSIAATVLSAMNDRSSLYSITSRGLIFDNMMVMHDGVRQTPENLSSMPTKIIFQQTLLQRETRKLVAVAADASVIDRGIAAVSSVTQSATDLFSRSTEAAGRVLGL